MEPRGSDRRPRPRFFVAGHTIRSTQLYARRVICCAVGMNSVQPVLDRYADDVPVEELVQPFRVRAVDRRRYPLARRRSRGRDDRTAVRRRHQTGRHPVSRGVRRDRARQFRRRYRRTFTRGRRPRGGVRCTTEPSRLARGRRRPGEPTGGRRPRRLAGWAAEADQYRHDEDPIGSISGVGPRVFSISDSSRASTR